MSATADSSCGELSEAKHLGFLPGIAGRFNQRFFAPLRMTILSNAKSGFKRLWYGGPNAIGNAIGYAEDYSRSHEAVIRVYDDAGNLIETQEHTGDFKAPIQLPARNSTLSETIHQRPMRA